MKLIVISSSKQPAQEHKIVTALLESGLKTFHVRKPSMSTLELRNYIEAIPQHFHNRLVIHSHHKLASKYKLAGIHLTNVHRQRKFSSWLRIRMLTSFLPNLIVSTSFYNLGRLYTNKQKYSYIFLGTIFNGFSGELNPGFNKYSIRAGQERIDIPLIARGGITKDSLQSCNDLNFQGAALASCIWGNPDPVNQWSEILKFLAAKEISHT